MAFCDKCGGMISDDMKYCDKCGSLIQHDSEPANQDNEYNYDEGLSGETNQEVEHSEHTVENEKATTENTATNSGNKAVLSPDKNINKIIDVLPDVFKRPGSKLMHLCAIASYALISLSYIVCFFSFMTNISFVVGCSAAPDILMGIFGTSTANMGAGSLWMIIYFLLNLLPVSLIVISFLKPDKKIFAPLASVICFTMTFISLIAWGCCEASDFITAVTIYPTLNEWGTFAWYCLVDCLSEAWYIKIPFALISCFALIIDNTIKKSRLN